MPIVRDYGDGNTLLLPLELKENSEIVIKGSNNFIDISQARLGKIKILIESNESKLILNNCSFTGTVFMKGVGRNCISIDEGTTIGGATFICSEGSSITIGKDCMISWDTEFRTTDSHAIYSMSTSERVNPASNISIADHVWIGAHTRILKGSSLSKGSVVALGSIVTKKFPLENIVCAGNPAKIIKEGVYWDRTLLG